MKCLFKFSSALLLVLLLSFCSDENNPAKPDNLDNDLIGRWVFVDSNNDIAAWTFKDDGTAIQTIYNQDFNWKWEIENGQIKLFVDGGKPAYYTYKIEGNELYLKVDSMDQWGLPFTKS